MDRVRVHSECGPIMMTDNDTLIATQTKAALNLFCSKKKLNITYEFLRKSNGTYDCVVSLRFPSSLSFRFHDFLAIQIRINSINHTVTENASSKKAASTAAAATFLNYLVEQNYLSVEELNLPCFAMLTIHDKVRGQIHPLKPSSIGGSTAVTPPQSIASRVSDDEARELGAPMGGRNGIMMPPGSSFRGSAYYARGYGGWQAGGGPPRMWDSSYNAHTHWGYGPPPPGPFFDGPFGPPMGPYFDNLPPRPFFNGSVSSQFYDGPPQSMFDMPPPGPPPFYRGYGYPYGMPMENMNGPGPMDYGPNGWPRPYNHQPPFEPPPFHRHSPLPINPARKKNKVFGKRSRSSSRPAPCPQQTQHQDSLPQQPKPQQQNLPQLKKLQQDPQQQQKQDPQQPPQQQQILQQPQQDQQEPSASQFEEVQEDIEPVVPEIPEVARIQPFANFTMENSKQQLNILCQIIKIKPVYKFTDYGPPHSK